MPTLFHRRLVFRACLLPFGLGWALAPAAAHAQMHHVDAPERVTRALGVYEWTGELSKPTAARFVPVSLFINGKMQDAGLYLARPVPFALGTGDVYSLEHAGEPQGLLDLDYAQHVVVEQPAGNDDPVGAWYGYGKFTPQAAPKVANLHPSTRLPVIQSDGKPAANAEEGRPHMSRRGDAPAPAPPPGDTPKTSETGAGSSSTAPASSGTTAPGSTDSADDSDRPTLRHRDPSQDASRKREYGTKSKQASVTAVGPGPGDDPDRPVLGRNTEADSGTPPLLGLPADMHQAVGVSDPVHRADHNFAREWDTPAERTLTESGLEAAARTRVAAYLVANNLVPSSAPLPREQATVAVTSASAAEAEDRKAVDPGINTEDAGAPPKLQRGVPSQYQPSAPSGTPAKAGPAAPTQAPAAAPKTLPRSTPAATNHAAQRRAPRAGKTSPAVLTLVGSSVTGYTLSYGGLPTFVYTAAASVASTKPALPSPASPDGVPAVPAAGGGVHPAVFVTVVAQRLPSGELQVVLSSVTDSLHLDRSPRLRLIDAVDPDSSHRASLLFELRGGSSRQFALYRLTAAQAEQIFTTSSIE